MAAPLHYQSIPSLALAYRERSLSSLEVTRHLVSRIKQLNPLLNSFITVLEQEALEQANELDREGATGIWRGPLHGVPVAIKDFYDTRGVKTTAAAEQFRDRVPSKDAEAVTRLRQAGAVILGKTNMHTLGMGTTGLVSIFGPVKNPWNADFVPGGSSSGSAAAVASGLCFATLDTDAVGSVRLPAACCHVVGLKPSYGTVSMKGILEGTGPLDPFIKWMGHAGITARSVEDARLMLQVLSDRPAKAQENSPSARLRIGVGSNLNVAPEVARSFETATSLLEKLGHSVRPHPIPLGDPARGLSHIEIDRSEIATKAFADIDLLMLPTTPTTVPTVRAASDNEQALSAELTAFANYYGLPAISVPWGFDANGLPLGLQLVGRAGDEDPLLRVAAEYQSAIGPLIHPTP